MLFRSRFDAVEGLNEVTGMDAPETLGSPTPSGAARIGSHRGEGVGYERDEEERRSGASAEAPSEAVAELYAELRRLAERHLSGGGPTTFQATALVNETYLRLGDRYEWRGRAAFLALASRAMRHILVDHARARRSRAPVVAVDLDAVVVRYEEHSRGLVDLDAAFEKLAARDPALVRLVELRFFGGCEMDEIAELMDISPRKAARWWSTARGFLRREVDGR